MRRTQNKVSLIGYVTLPPNFSNVGNKGIPYAVFTVVTNDPIKKSDPKTPGKYVIENRPNYHKVVAWRRMAEIVRDYVKAKAYLSIDGKLLNTEYTSGEGKRQRSTEIVLEDILFLDKGQAHSEPYAHSGTNSQFQEANVQEEFIDEIPQGEIIDDFFSDMEEGDGYHG